MELVNDRAENYAKQHTSLLDEVLNEIKENFDLIPLTNDLLIYKQKIPQTAE